MFLSLCGIAVACSVTAPPAQVATTIIPSPPRVVEVEQRTLTKPRQRRVIRNPPRYLYQDHGCAEYNCIGPQTTFRLPDEIPYSYYEQQYLRPQRETYSPPGP